RACSKAPGWGRPVPMSQYLKRGDEAVPTPDALVPYNSFRRGGLAAGSGMRQVAGRKILFAAIARAAPRPIPSRSHQARFHRVGLDVANDLTEMLLVSNIVVEVIFFPKRAGTMQQPIRLFRGVALPALEDFAQRRLP